MSDRLEGVQESDPKTHWSTDVTECHVIRQDKVLRMQIQKDPYVVSWALPHVQDGGSKSTVVFAYSGKIQKKRMEATVLGAGCAGPPQGRKDSTWRGWNAPGAGAAYSGSLRGLW